MNNEPDIASFFAGIIFTLLVFGSCSVCNHVVQGHKASLREEGRIEALQEIHGLPKGEK